MRQNVTLLDGGRSVALGRAAVVVGLAACFAAGWISFHQGRYTLAIGAVGVLAGLAVADPLAIATLALPTTLVLVRAGGSGAGSSIAMADLMVAVGSILALPLLRWDAAPALRRVLAAAGIYEVTLVAVVAAHPNSHDLLEAIHRLFIISGSLIVGWAVARTGRADMSVKIFLVLASLLGLFAMAVSAAHGFKPAYINFLGYQKNAIGAYMWISVAIVQFRPRWLHLSDRAARTIRLCTILGLIGSQSKQSVIALFAVIVVGMVRHTGIRRRSRRLLPLLIIAGAVVYVAVSTQLNAKAGTINSATVRLTANSSDIAIWKLDPLVGQGMRWFYLPQFAGNIQPTNILYEGLTDSGILGLGAFAAMLWSTSRTLGRLSRDIGTLALAVLLGRLVEGVFDSYWIGAMTSIPWLLAGLSLGTADSIPTGAGSDRLSSVGRPS